MSRAPAASFAQFFPSAPRAAKDKAKEREKVKPQTSDSTTKPPVADSPLGASRPPAEDASSFHPAGEGNIPVTDSAAPSAEDHASPPGDILNGVGSASSYASTISSVFSAPPTSQNMSTSGVAQHVSSLTPLTAIDSSPNHAASPYQDKSVAESGPVANYSVSHDDAPQPQQPAIADREHSGLRVHARDPTRGIKGTICTYDPNLDRKLGSNEKKKAKPTYKEFGLVRIHNLLGSVILIENVWLMTCRKMTRPQQTRG